MGLDNGVRLDKEGLMDKRWRSICRRLRTVESYYGVDGWDAEDCEVAYWRKLKSKIKNQEGCSDESYSMQR